MAFQIIPFLISIAISMILSAAAAYIAKQNQEAAEKKLKSQLNQERGIQIKANTISTAESLRVIYGKHRVGGNDVYMNTASKHNRILWIIQGIGEGTLDSIYQVDSVDQVFVDDTLYTELNAKDTDHTLIAYNFYDGSPTQNISDGGLWADFSAANKDYTDNLRNTAFMLWKFRWNEDVFRGIPSRELVIKGRKLYDFRTSTTAWSDNPVLALYDFFTNSRYGIGIDSAIIDTVSWGDVADYCDKIYPYDSRTGPKFKVNYVINVGGIPAWDAINGLLELFRGTLNYYNGTYYLRFADLNEEASVLTIEDKHIVQNENGKASLRLSQPTSTNIPTAIRVTFIDAEKDWTEDSFIISDEESVVHDVCFEGCTDKEIAGILGHYELERLQLNRGLSGKFRDDCIFLEPGDIINFNSSSFAIEDQPMRVMSVGHSQIGLVDLALQYEALELYNDSYDIVLDNIYKVNLPDPTDPSSIANATIEEELYYYRLRSFSRLKISFTIPDDDPWFKHVEVWVSTDGNVEANYKHQFNSNENFVIDPVEEGKEYWIVLKTVNIYGAKQKFNDATKLSYLVTGKSSTRPPSLSYLSAVPGDNSLTLMSDKLDDPDIEAYEFRFGPQWIGGIFMGSYRSPNFSVKNIKPGFFEFTANTLGTNGLYGLVPVYASARIPLPKGYIYFNEYLMEVSGGGESHDNTEWYYYNNSWYLKCSHTAGVLTGTYISPEYDIGPENINTYFSYIDSTITITGLGTTWGEIAPPPTTWANLDAENNMWSNIIEIDVAPVISMELQYRENETDTWKAITKAEFTAGVIYLRFIRVKVTITDPTTEVNGLISQPIIKLYK